MSDIMRSITNLLICALLITSIVFLSSCDNTTKTSEKDRATQTAEIQSQPVKQEIPEVIGVKLKDIDQGGTLKGQYKGKKIVVASIAGNDKTLNNVAKYFKQYSGADVEVRTFPDSSYMEDIQRDLNSIHSFDVVVMPIAFIHSYAQSELIQNLTPYINDKSLASPNFDIDDFIPSLLEKYGVFGGELVAFPFKPDVQILFYRKDLFEDKKVKADFKASTGKVLEVPKTPYEFLETAKFFTKAYNPNSPVNYGYVSMAAKGPSRWIWTNRLAAFGGRDVDKDFKPGFNNQAGIDALKFTFELQKYAPKQWLQFKWEESNKFFGQGDVAMMENWPYSSVLAEQETSKVKGKVGYAVTPGGTPTIGGWAASITSTSKEPELAYKFIEFMTSKDGEFLKLETDFCRSSNYAKNEVNAYNKLYPTLKESLSKGKVLADPDVPFISEKLNNIFEEGVQSVLTGKKTAEEAIKYMSDKFESEIRAVGLIE